MSNSTFTILRQCENCGNMFEAQKRTTRFCSHHCASQNYKLRKKLEGKKEVENQILKQPIRPVTKALNLELIKQKEFLTVAEISTLFSCSTKTIYRMIENKEINAINLSERLTRIRRKDIEQIFEKPVKPEPDRLIIENCYRLIQKKLSICTSFVPHNITTLYH